MPSWNYSERKADEKGEFVGKCAENAIPSSIQNSTFLSFLTLVDVVVIAAVAVAAVVASRVESLHSFGDCDF